MNASFQSVMRAVFGGLWIVPLFMAMAMALAQQAHGSGWQKTLGGAGAVQKGYSLQQVSDDGYIVVGISTVFRVRQTTDGGYIIAGSAQSAGGSDIYLVKTDGAGNSQWEKTFGGEGDDYGNSVQQTTDGGYIIAGNTASYGAGGADVYLIKTDAAGNSQWESTFGGASNDTGYSTQQTTDGGYIITGQTESYGAGGADVYLVKTDAAGNTQWERTFGGEYGDTSNSVQQTIDGGFIVAGVTSGTGVSEADVYLIKTDGAGNPQWEEAIGGTANETGFSVQQTADGGYIVAGQTYSFGAGNSDVYLVKTDTGGNVQWGKTFGGIGDDVGYSVQQTTDGGYIIAGNTLSFHSQGDVYLIKTDASGNTEWEKTP